MNDTPFFPGMVDPVRQLSGWLQPTDIVSLELLGPDTRIALRRQGAQWVQAAEPAPDPVAPAGHVAVRAPCVGLLRLCQPGREQPLVSAGQQVVTGQPLALLQIGLVLVPVLAPCAGQVQPLQAEDGAAVGYGTALFELV